MRRQLQGRSGWASLEALHRDRRRHPGRDLHPPERPEGEGRLPLLDHRHAPDLRAAVRSDPRLHHRPGVVPRFRRRASDRLGAHGRSRGCRRGRPPTASTTATSTASSPSAASASRFQDVPEIPDSRLYQGPDEVREWAEGVLDVSRRPPLRALGASRRDGDAVMADTERRHDRRQQRRRAVGWRFWTVWRVKEALDHLPPRLLRPRGRPGRPGRRLGALPDPEGASGPCPLPGAANVLAPRARPVPCDRRSQGHGCENVSHRLPFQGVGRLPGQRRRRPAKKHRVFP